jgi:TetR/AcrR family transcriptional repressor of mexJK operon
MSAITDQQDLKREKILDAAYQRFLHFGYSKTTMNEIAGDLSMSKALLYYYFPDKSELYVAVMKKLADNYIELLREHVTGFDNLKDAFNFQIDTQHNFIVNNYNFFDFFRLNEQSLPDAIWDIIGLIHQTEIDLLASVIRDQIAQKKISEVNNPEQIVDLFLDALHGVRVRVKSYKKNIFPQKEHLEEIHQKRLLLADIFVKGLLH